MTRALVTGGCGFVGRPLTQALTDAGVEVHVLDDLSRGTATAAGALHRADIRDAAAVAAAVQAAHADVVFHLAAMHFIPDGDRNPGECIAINTGGTAVLLDQLDRAGSEAAVVLASTAAVYRPADVAHRERDLPHPVDVYGRSKLWAEELVRDAAARGRPAAMARLFNVAGEGETNPHLIPALAAQAVQGEDVRAGDLSTRRDYVHVEDVAEALIRLAAIAAPGEPPVLNIGTGRAISGLEVVAAIEAATGHPLRVRHDVARTRPSDRPLLLADVAEATRLLGWTAQRTAEQAIADAVHAAASAIAPTP